MVFVGVHVFEAQVFKFVFQLVKTESMGERNIDVQGFLGNQLPFFGLHVSHGTHIMDAVCDFDHDDPGVFGHGRNQFTVGFRFLGCFA